MRIIRSVLFIPGDDEKKLGKADASAADAIVLDLEDAVAPSRKPIARQLVREFLDARRERTSQLWVRINPLDTPDALKDLVAVVGGAPDCLMQPKANGPVDVAQLSYYLDALEAREGLDHRRIAIHSIATETALSTFTLGEYARASLPRLIALSWGAEDLSTAIGGSSNKGLDGDWDFPFKIVRANCLFAAHAARVQAIDTLYANFRDLDGLRASCDVARRQGFTGRVAIHPAQVDIINAAFSPSEEDVARATQILNAFAAQPDAGTIAIDGEMFDIPHLNQARQILALHNTLR